MSYWRHPPAKKEDYCPFRVEGSDSGISPWDPDWAALKDVLLKVKDKLEERGTECSIGSAGGERAGLIGSWGAIVPINPGNVEIQAERPEVEGRTVIPIIALESLESLNRHNLAPYLRQIVDRQPVPVIRPKMEGPAGPWSLLTDGSQLSPEQVEDMIVGAIPIPINARELFGEPAAGASFAWPPPGLVPIWVWTDYKDGLDAVKDGLDHTLPLGTKVLRLLAKRLLVDGGSVHRALFAQSLEDARDFFLIAEKTFPRSDQIVRPEELVDVGRDTELVGILRGNRLLHGCFEDFETQGKFEPVKRRALEKAQARHEKELMEAQARHKEDLIEAEAKYEKELMAAQTRHEEELKEHQQSKQEELMEAEAKYERAIRQHQQECDENRSRVEDLKLQVGRLEREMEREREEHSAKEENFSRELAQAHREFERTRRWMWLALAVALILIVALVATWALSS
jgi:hypothetical protein